MIELRSHTYWHLSVFLTLTLMVQMSGTNIQAVNNETYFLTGRTAAIGGWSKNQQTILTGSACGSPQQYCSDGSRAISGGVVGIGFGRGSILPITHTLPTVDTTAEFSRAIALHIESGSGLPNGRLYYRKGGEDSFTKHDMTILSSGDSLHGEIPWSVFSVRGVEYYVDVERDNLHAAIGTRSNPRRLVTRVTNQQGQRVSQIPDQKYRIISVPVDIEWDSSIEAVFEDDFGGYDKSHWRLSRYNGITGTYSEFPDVAPVAPGRGYWLITRDLNRSYGSAGLSVQPNRTVDGKKYYELPLDSGWNQLGNPFAFDIEWIDVLFSVGGQIIGHEAAVVEDSIYWYDGTRYRTIKTIPAWDGFFLNVRSNEVTALIPYRESNAAKAALSPRQGVELDPDEWTLRLSLEVGNLVDGDNFVGVRHGASHEIDRFDYVEPPRAPGATGTSSAPMLALGGSTRLDSFGTKGQSPRPLLRCDYRESGQPGHRWKLLMSPGADRLLSLDGINELPNGLQLSLVYDGGRLISLTSDTSIVVPDDATEATLIAGSVAFVVSDEPPLPRQFALYQNRPNPFNPSSAISFALPESRYVTLDVINILGQKVSRLVDGRLTAGYHSVTWDGRNSSGRSVASGIYFYRITAGDFMDSRKMVLIR